MLAKAFRGVLPPLTEDEIIEVTSIHSMQGHSARISSRNHHSCASSYRFVRVTHWRWGFAATWRNHFGNIVECSFSTNFPEFNSAVIDALREPLEEKRITVSRVRGSVTFPAHCILIAAMNPCPCGYGDDRCTCTSGGKQQYLRKISGPLIDRIDVWVAVSKIEYEKFGTIEGKGETSEAMLIRIEKARTLQYDRCKKYG